MPALERWSGAEGALRGLARRAAERVAAGTWSAATQRCRPSRARCTGCQSPTSRGLSTCAPPGREWLQRAGSHQLDGGVEHGLGDAGVIVVRWLAKRYRATLAVDQLSFDV